MLQITEIEDQNFADVGIIPKFLWTISD